MTDPELVVRIAAKGDGVTADGRFLAGAVPGDRVDRDGSIIRGPNHIDAACRHFGKCGGCQLQQADDYVLAQFVRDRVLNAAEGQDVVPEHILPVHQSPPGSRRRAALHAIKTQNGSVLGYREEGSHKIVDLKECPVLLPQLVQLVAPLRSFVAQYGGKGAIEIALTAVDQGVDCAITNVELEGLEATEAALEFARENSIARLSIDQGYGPDTVWEPDPVTVTLGGVPVGFPPGAFLQATRDAQQIMVADAVNWIGDAKLVADLFAGLGTFAFALAKGRRILAAEAEGASHLACKSAAGHAVGLIHAMHRDLFRNPLTSEEIERFDAVLLDPPRAGAKDQVMQIAESALAKVIYISCNPSSWARDAKRLCDAGFKLKEVRPVGQFRWSTHVELTSLFER